MYVNRSLSPISFGFINELKIILKKIFTPTTFLSSLSCPFFSSVSVQDQVPSRGRRSECVSGQGWTTPLREGADRSGWTFRDGIHKSMVLVELYPLHETHPLDVKGVSLVPCFHWVFPPWLTTFMNHRFWLQHGRHVLCVWVYFERFYRLFCYVVCRSR